VPSTPHDVLVVGAGPAGSTSAQRLARAGFRVALLDARTFPRFKACGEFMSPECLPMLADLGVTAEMERSGARAVSAMRLFAHGRTVEGRFVDVGAARAPAAHGWALRREVFDQVLLESARATPGVEVFEGWRVASLARDAGGRVLGLEACGPGGERRAFRAAWTVGADGLRSLVGGQLGAREEIPWLRKLALTTRYAGVPWGAAAEVHFFDGGYVAAAPVDGGLVSVNVILDMERNRAAGLTRDARFERSLARLPAIAARLAAGRRVDPVRGLGPLAARTRAQTFDGAALVGDAAGYVDPVTGEGLFFALRGAALLSEELARALHARRTDAPALAGYCAGRARELAPRARAALLLQRALRHPWLVRGAARVLAARPGLADVLVSVTGDYVPLGELVRPSVWARALRARPAA